MSKPLKKQPLALNTSKINSILSTSFTKKVNKSLVSSFNNDFIQLSQSQVNFINTEQNQVYQITFTIRNVSQKSTKVKIRKPKSQYLNVSLQKDGNLAPGLDKKIVVTFNSQVNLQIRDRLYLYCQDQFDIQVPVCVFPCVYHLNYQPFINFGLKKTGKNIQHVIKIQNKGNNIAEIRLEPLIKGVKVVIEPSCLTIQPNSQQMTILNISSNQNVEFEGTIQIFPQLLGQACIEVVGSFCDYSRFLADSQGKQISQLHIPSLFGGQKVISSFFIVNNTPKSCQFRLIRKRGTNLDQQTVLITPQQFGRDDQQKNIIFSSIQGQIEPYSKKQITCNVIAKIDQHDQQLFCNYTSGRIKLLPYDSRQWCYTISTNFKDQQHNKNLLIKGESIIPKFCISSTFFKFGDCYIRSKQEKILKIQNLSDKPLNIIFEKSQNYSCLPETFQVPIDGEKEVIIKFCPKVVGELQQICHIKVASFSFPIKMFGKGIFTKQSMKKSQVGKTQNSMDQSRGIQLNVADMDKTMIQQQISIINQKSIYMQENSKISATNFDMTTLSTKTKTQNKNIVKKKTIKNKNGKQVIVDIQNFNADEEIDQYPGFGKSSQQDRMVSRQLSLNQFKNIPVGPVILDFGQIFVLSAQKKYFHVCNLNLKPISIQMETKDNHQFDKTSKQMQILPGQSHGGLKVIYQAHKQGKFKHQLQYVINGRHYFDILAVGTAILPTIQLSKTQFRFVAGQDDHTFQKKQTLILNNPYPYQVQYGFQVQKQSTFKFIPAKGKISANSKQSICIIHNFLGSPQGGGKIQQNIRLKIKNGKLIDIKCISIVPQCSMICKPNQCNFKEISVCKPYQMKFSLKNSSKNFTIFKIVPNKDIEQQVKITTTKTILAIDEISQVTVKLMSQKQQIIQSGLTIIVRGGRKLFVSIKANVIIPKIKIQGDQINFGSRPVGGNPTSKQITLVNQSLIPVQLQLMLPSDSFLYKCLSIKSQTNQLRTVFPVKQLKQKKAKSYQIKISKKCKAQICLQFQPQQVKDYKFTLPLYLTGNYQPNVFLQKNVICRSLKNRLLTDLKQLDFGKTIIEQSLDNLPKNVTFTLINPQEQDVQWWSTEKNIEPFSLQIKKGIIKGNSQLKIKAFFYSQNPGVFQKQLQFFVNNSDFEPSRPYLKLPIKATANYPEIYFDRPYVILPTVRLNEQSIGKFQILNGGYENLNLKHTISQQYSNIDLNVKYINGCNLGITKKSITVMVSFKSERPISFTLKIQFYDHHSRVFSIFVSGTADNSLYVLPDSYWLPDIAEQLSKSASFLTTFLNSLGFVEDNLYDFPTCLVDNDFQNFNKFLQNCANQPQKLQKFKPNSKKTITIQQKYENLAEILKMLKSDGAFLSEIRPEFLMNQSDYIQMLKLKSQNIRIFSNYKLPNSEQIKQQFIKSWIILIYQIFRIYSKVPNKKKAQNSDIWTQLLQKQRTIINWLQQCYQNQANLQQIKSSNQLNDLADGEMLSALITKYTNIKILDVYGKVSNIIKQRQKRCRKIVEICSQIGIAPGVKVEDLMRSKPVEMLVFLERLYMILPYYLQKGDPIVFSCATGQSLTKSIQIKNPSKFPVTYIAKIQGSKAYIIQNQQQFQIQPKQKHEVQIKYISNIDIQKTNATLTLTGKTSNKFTPSTFIFVLKTVNLGRISQKNIQVTGQLYQPYQFQIHVKNNFNMDTVLNIQVFPINAKVMTKNLFCMTPTIKLKKDQAISIPFVFLPFMLQTHKFQILFKDPKVGQFQYDITGLVDMPQVMSESLRFNQTFFTNKLYNVQLLIPQKNQQILRARRQIDSYLQKVQRKSQTTQTTLQARRASLTNALLDRNLYPNIKQQNYTLSLMPQTDMVVLKTTSITLDPFDQQPNSTKKINLQINMKMPAKQAPIYLVMKNNSNTDIRRYKILINSIYKPLRYELQIKIPVNQTITQPLPLINISNQPNTFNTTFLTNQSTLSRNVFIFQNQKDITVKPKEQYLVNLTFTPKLQQIYNALLKIQNITNGQIVQYQINAIGQQPIAQILKFQQKTGQIQKYQIKLPFIKPQKCTVTKCTFSPTNIKYQKIFWYNSQSTCFFNFTYYTKIPGIYQGKIYLQDQIKIYAYNITIVVNQSIQGIIQIKSIQRLKKQVQIKIQKGHWYIEHNDINLIIPQQIQMLQSGLFKFGYIGNKAGQYQSYLIFKNQNIGYMKYLLKIIIEQHPQTIISNLQVQLGKIHTFTVKLQNPDNNQIIVTGTCTNIQVFYYQPENSFVIPAKSYKEVKFMYRPTCLQLQTGKIYFTATNNIKWKYDLSGCGVLQNQEQIKQIDAEIGTQVIQTINFVNPFKKNVHIHIFLQNDNKNQQIFKLISKTNKYSLNYLQQIQIPIKFTCTQAKIYTCKLKILINQKIYWRHILNIRTISKIFQQTKIFKFVARSKKQLTTTFILPHLSKDMNKNDNKFKCILTAQDANQQALLRNNCRVMKQWEQLQENKVSFLLNFLSYRPFNCPFFFQIYQQNNCKWIFKGQVQYMVPPPDDQFEILSEINKATSVMFRLNNRVKSHAKFKAYFTSDSDMEFSITPKSGDLEPFGREGSQFQVTFAPTQYKNSWHGKIIIQTEDSYWSYLVKGNLPHYIPPVGKSNLTTSTVKKTNHQP